MDFSSCGVHDCCLRVLYAHKVSIGDDDDDDAMHAKESQVQKTLLVPTEARQGSSADLRLFSPLTPLSFDQPRLLRCFNWTQIHRVTDPETKDMPLPLPGSLGNGTHPCSGKLTRRYHPGLQD